jgi:hypothetical protein
VRSLLRRHFEGFAGGIIDANLGWRSVFDGFRRSSFFAFHGFTLVRKVLCRRKFFRLSID